MSSGNCPTEDELFALANDEPGASPFRAHLRECTACQDRVEELSAQMNSVRLLGRGSSWASPAATGRSRPVFIGKYFVSGTLSENDLWTLHRGLHGVLKVDVQITKFKQSCSTAAREAIANACRKLAAVQHPGVARVLDIEFSEGAPCLVHERVTGTPLGVWLDQHGRSSSRAQRTLLQAAEALVDVHGHGLAHGAIDAASLVVDDEGRPRLLGLGARHLQELIGGNTGAAVADAQREDVQALCLLIPAATERSSAAEIASALRRRMNRPRRMAMLLGAVVLGVAVVLLALWAAGLI